MTPDRTNVVIVGSLVVVIAGTLALAAMQDRPEARSPGWDEPPSPYEACLLAANHPGPSGFAPKVCEPLSPLFQPGQYVYVGRDSWQAQGATVSVPPLAEQVADSCPDEFEGADVRAALLGCVRTLIAERQEHPR